MVGLEPVSNSNFQNRPNQNAYGESSNGRLRERWPHLEDLRDGVDLIRAARRLALNGLDAWQWVLERGYESHMVKDESSPASAAAGSGGVSRALTKLREAASLRGDSGEGSEGVVWMQPRTTVEGTTWSAG